MDEMNNNDGWGSGWPTNSAPENKIIGTEPKTIIRDEIKSYGCFDDINKKRAKDNIDGWQTIDTTPRQVELTLDDVVVKATQVFDLAVHPDLKVWGQWQICHVPTLLSFMKVVSVGQWSEYQLIEWCKNVQQTCRKEWVMLASLTPDIEEITNWQHVLARDVIQKHCLSVPVC